jgi:DNA-binding NtrC family response regulator
MERPTAARAYAVVYQGDHSTHVDLPRDATVEIGRSRSCLISLGDQKASRLHATLTWDGTTLLLKDLGSTNGTLVNGKRVQGEILLKSGDEIAVGAATVVVGLTAPAGAVGRRILAHADFEDRLVEEVARAHRYRRSLGLLMVRLPPGADASRLSAAVREMDVLGAYGPQDLEVLLPEVDADGAMLAAKRIVVERPGARVGLAVFPSDAGDQGPLVSAARLALRTTNAEAPVARAPSDRPVEPEPVSVDPAMQRVFALVDRVAPREIAVLVTGETGVGKEIVAREIHRRGRGPARAFIAVNCAALPETLVDSELFGHEKGAFTGAATRKAGLFEAAHGGTIFLDEIGELGQATQGRLLRVLERHEVLRVGATQPVAVDVRVIAATNRDLEREVRRGAFREDLFFRLNAFTIVVPPLRDRPLDLGPLTDRFVADVETPGGRGRARLTDAARAALSRWSWPGNVRELKNVLERAALLSEDDVVDVGALPDRLRGAETPAAGGSVLRDRVDALERESLVRALERCSGNQTRAAEALGMSRRALIYKMEKLGLKPKPH